MQISHKRWLAAVMLGAVVLTTATVHDAAAKKKSKASMTAKVNGKAYKGKAGTFVATYSTAITGIGSNTGFKPLRIGARARTIAFVCSGDLKTLTPPVTLVQTQTLPSCNGEYNESRRGTIGMKRWPSSSLSVTFKSIDGLKVQGEFEGTFPPHADNPGEPTVTITKGKFSMLLTDLGF